MKLASGCVLLALVMEHSRGGVDSIYGGKNENPNTDMLSRAINFKFVWAILPFVIFIRDCPIVEFIIL